MRPTSTSPATSNLIAFRTRFGPEAATAKLDLLRQLPAHLPRQPKALLDLHEGLLFIAAYPDNAAVLAAAEAALAAVAHAAAAMIAGRNAAHARRLADTGIVGTPLSCAFSIDLADWLVRRFPADVDLDWEDGSAGAALDEFLPALAASVERDGLIDERLSALEWMNLALGANAKRPQTVSRLAWLISAFDRLGPRGELLDRAFESLDLHIRWHLRDPIGSRTTGRFPARPPHFQSDDLLRSFDVADLLNRPLPAHRPLPPRAAAALLDVCRATLAVRHRETDPITYADPRAVYLLRLERGVDVAVFAMTPRRRLSIESFFGYVATRNRVPMAYGGGWVFFDRCEVGVNIFDTFRGGESAFVFTQILRVYRHLFQAARFTVDPFQFGAGNPEAIKSGAYWFYDRLGFRPAQADLAALADAERAKARADRAYRSPAAVLRRLAKSRLELDLPWADCPPRPDPALGDLALAVTAWIGREFAGDRVAAERAAIRRVRAALPLPRRRIDPEASAAFERLALLVAQIDDLEDWPRADRLRLAEALLAKGGPSEFDYAHALRKHARLHAALASVAQRGNAAIKTAH